MSTGADLITWGSPEELGKIPNSEWMCPTGPLPSVQTIHRLGGSITADDLQILAEGRPQHLELHKFPEGQHAVKVIDSETGETLTKPGRTYKYAGLLSCNCGAIHESATVASVLAGSPIPLDEGKELSNVYNFDDGTQTIVRPTEVDRDEADYIPRLRTGMHLSPQSRNLFMFSQSPVRAIDNGNAEVDIRQRGDDVEAKLTIFQTDRYDVTGQVQLDLDGTGQIQNMTVYKNALLRTIGIRDSLDFGTNDFARVTDTSQQAKIADALAEAIGMERWSGLDLRLTASGLYKAMGARNFDLTTTLVPRT